VTPSLGYVPQKLPSENVTRPVPAGLNANKLERRRNQFVSAVTTPNRHDGWWVVRTKSQENANTVANSVLPAEDYQYPR
jgi:hypothetical protein